MRKKGIRDRNLWERFENAHEDAGWFDIEKLISDRSTI